MATTGRQTAYQRTQRAYHFKMTRNRPLTQQDYEDRRDCCCHKLGRLRPHLAIECREVM